MTLTPGLRLGTYEILGPLGSGGMGEVYRARDTRLDRDVAVKVLPASMASNPGELARFEREAKMVAALNHPSIVTLHSIEEADAIRFITMELVEGESLARLVIPGGLPLARVLEIAIPLADALAVAHGRGVVHRDLKPANVMTTRDGRVKVLDFGLAKLFAAEPASTDPEEMGPTRAIRAGSAVSETGRVVGTAPYMAPEQLRGEPVDARTDLFALGIILYELVAGRRPFEGASYAEISSAILRDAPAPAQTLRPDLPPDLNRIISRCLEKNRERRFQTAKDVRNELELVRWAMESAAPGMASRPDAAPAGAASISRAGAPESPGPVLEAPSIAVLPFVNRSRDEEDEYFTDGLTDELMNLLAKIRGLRVAARTSSYHFKGRNEDVAAIGRKLNVAALLEGTVRKAGHRVRISVQMVKVSDGYQLWSESYDRTLDDIFAVQDDIAQAVVKELRTTLMGEDPSSSGQVRAAVQAAARGRGENVEAHRLFLQGRYFLERFTREDVAKGIGYLEQALALDPDSAAAWVELSRAQNHQAAYGWTPSVAAARDAAERAIALEPELPEAHLMLGAILANHDWNWKGADASFRRAMDLARGRGSWVLRGAGTLAVALGHIDEGLQLSRRAAAADPLSAAAHSSLGYVCRYAGLLDEAQQALEKALELSPQRMITHLVLGLVRFEQGMPEEALAEAEREPAPIHRLFGLAFLHARMGHVPEADEALRELIERFGDVGAFQIAGACVGRGETDRVFEWLDRGYVQRDPGLAMLRVEPLFRPVHGDPRWAAFLEKMGFAEGGKTTQSR